MALYKYLILLTLTDSARMDLDGANSRLQEVRAGLLSSSNPMVSDCELFALSGRFDYAVFIDCDERGAMIAATAFNQAGPVMSESMSCMDPGALEDAIKINPLIRRTGPRIPPPDVTIQMDPKV